ncbi:MAG TPA: CotH kinase family protein, partial [Methylomirabilota bacterium]|nr:CotH kinase family protein [Methylomirabilota bacterium]
TVGIHLKGSIGSFRSIDDKPGLTLSFEKFVPQQRFHGLRKFHLNNSVEDASYMNELIGSDLFQAAGVPAPRVGHAIVELNGRALGLYVLKEGFAEEFLARFFSQPEGNLYDIAREGHDVNEAMEKDFGKGPDDRSDLEAVAAAALEPDLRRRRQRLDRTLDVERFVSFMAMEILLGHRDGYCLYRNNFRVYQDVDSGRMIFFPHGMDQMFGNPRAAIQPTMNGLVARAFMEMPEGRAAYRSRCAFLITNVLNADRISQRIDQTIARLRPALNREASAALEREGAALKERVAARIIQAEQQLQQAPLELLRFESNTVNLSTGWQPVDIPEGGRLAQTNTADGKRALMIRAGPVTSASWRTKVLLPRGRYLFQGKLKTEGVERLKFGKNHGAVLKVPIAPSARSEPVLGNQAWKTLRAPFEVAESEREVELVCELRAGKGTVWFDREALCLIRVP